VLSGCTASRPVTQLGPLPPAALRLASYNIRYLDLTERGEDHPRGLAAWAERRQLVLAVLRHLSPDVIGFQEMESWTGAPQAGPPLQQNWLRDQLPDYGVAACECATGRQSSQPIFFRTRRFAAIDQGIEDLGTAPGLAGAFAGYSDLITWVRLRDRVSGSPLTVINLHLHFSDRLRRISGAEAGRSLAMAAMARGDRVVVLGDLNTLRPSRPVAVLESGGLTHVPIQGATYHFNHGLHLFDSIDHFFLGPGLVADGSAQILRARSGALWPSDHHPIWVDLHPA